jgi:hypothetical protein
MRQRHKQSNRVWKNCKIMMLYNVHYSSTIIRVMELVTVRTGHTGSVTEIINLLGNLICKILHF